MVFSMLVFSRDIRKKRLDNSERLNALEEFRSLGETERNIALEHVQSPELDIAAISKRLGLAQNIVYGFFHSYAWEAINRELAKQRLRELSQLAIQTLRNIMLDPKRKGVAGQIAIAVLANNDLFKQSPKVQRTDNKMILLWGNDKRIEPSELASLNADKNKLPAASEAAGSAPVNGAV